MIRLTRAFIDYVIMILLVCLPGICVHTLSAEAQTSDVVIIGHKNLPDNPLSKVDVQNIFLGKKAKVDNTNLTVVILKSGDVHETFLQEYLSRTSSQYDKYWKKIVFTGQGKAPKIFETEEALIEYVKNTEGAIGYISTQSAKALESGSLRQFLVQ
jgi:ABC-type phosphate transport system substrate-binding protein